MADTAAFFAKKKTKKKKFKAFNANKIDASAVTNLEHVDAPEISEDVTTSLGGLSGLGSAAPTPGGGTDDKTNTDGDDQWADNTSGGGWGSSTNKPTTTSSGPKIAELLDMRALNTMRSAQDDVAERLRIEETKAALARAKEGMAKEAERLVAEKEAKEARASGKPMGGGGSLSSMAGGSGGKWVPAHMRNTGGGSRFGSVTRGPASMDGAGGFQKSVDMASEELFPDLADADKIVADKEAELKKEQDRMSAASSGGPTMAPAGWGSRKPLNLAAPPAERKALKLTSKKTEESSTTEEVKKEESTPAVEETKTETPTPAPVPVAAAAPVEDKPKKVLKKKKKKDLSTFKAK